MSLSDWLKSAWLVEHESSRQEITDLLSVIDRDVKDCRSGGLSSDWKMAIAYNAALQVALAALAAEGYRVARESHHFRAIQSMALTLGCENAVVAKVEAFRKKRNISDYERAGNVSNQEAEEMIALAMGLRRRLIEWLRSAHAELVSPNAAQVIQ